jgi:FtsP/CotA-like multicopper oxidase with cupredoxin domain
MKAHARVAAVAALVLLPLGPGSVPALAGNQANVGAASLVAVQGEGGSDASDLAAQRREQRTKTVEAQEKRVTDEERQAAAARAAESGLVVDELTAENLAQAEMAMPGEVPHYFSVPNYANSPLPILAHGTVDVGNPLVDRAYATDYAAPDADGLVPVLVVLPAALPDGILTSFETWNQALPGGSPTPSAGQQLRAYVLRPGTVTDELLVVHDSGLLTIPPLTGAVSEAASFAVPNVAVQAGDRIAFYGAGVPVDTETGTDVMAFPSTAAPVQGQTITVSATSTTYPVYPQARTYSFGAKVTDLSGASDTWSGGIRKFVDTLAGVGEANANTLGQYIPVAQADTTTYPGTDYYEIAVVEYEQKMHTDLAPTTVRGYIQLSTSVVPGKQVPLTYLGGTPIMLPNADGTPSAIQAVGADSPHYLGPIISATKDRPVRILFRNLLPTGEAGNLFLPVDTTVMGSGAGPAMDMAMGEPDPRNPMCGMPGVKDPTCFSENRATLHLHGGITPWISDGTPHQWITPAGENTAYPKGVSVVDVPDMPDPGPGAQTFFYSNQQSARLMFYHDHAWGITRLNVYAGEAAPYLITDPVEQKLIADAVIPGPEETIPLVVQDKTFVPSMGQLAMTDPLWDTERWGSEGDLWRPHVYVPAQNPGDASGVNQFGRWAYGPWFWPPTASIDYPPIDNPYYDPTCEPSDTQWCEPPLMPGVPYNSMGMEAFQDTPVVNGTAYPTTTVDPKTYRFRVLNAADDRFFNLSLYQADPAAPTEVQLNPDEVAAALTDTTVFPTPVAGTEGPEWVQIGTESGFLAAPTVVPAQPITWVNDPTVFNAGNVDQHSLLLGPAERGDVIVDFSQYAGQTLILYNDAPAAFPARDPRYDYYTGNADLTDTGGAPSTLPGYGPNTRTVMQIKVNDVAPAPAFDRDALMAAFAHQADGSGVFESGQHPIVVGQSGYNSAYGQSFASNGPNAGLAQIYDTSLSFKTVANGAAGASLTLPMQRKAIQDEMGEAFEKEYGRMSGNLGLEAPNTQAGLQQNLILYPFVNPATEILEGIDLPPGVDVTPISTASDGTQIWKITHNGVDTHPMHFHLYDVQLINRVGWDGIIRRPEPSETGWKETVRISPLEDTIVAIRPVLPKLPWNLPDSVRPLDPSMPLGTTEQFNSTDGNGNPIPAITNALVNFGWEYVWHCHILSHEEMDMMRPVQVNPDRRLPAPPVVTYTAGTPTTLSWTDGTPAIFTGTMAENLATWGSPSNELGFRIQQAVIAKNGRPGAYTDIATLDPNTTGPVEVAATSPTGRPYSYRVAAFNATGASASTPVSGVPLPVAAAPTNATTTLQAGPQISVTWRDNATNESYFLVERSIDGGAFTLLAQRPARTNTGNVTYVDTSVAAGHTYAYQVAAAPTATPTVYATTGTVAVPMPPVAPTNLAGTAVQSGKRANVALTWVDTNSAPANETGFTLVRATNPGFTVGVVSQTLAANTTTVTQTGLYRGVTYYYRIAANNLGGTSAWSNVASIVTP